VLTALAENLWTLDRPLRVMGLEMGTRMSIVRLASGGLFVHSPVSLDAALGDALAALGPVEIVAAPCLFHHLSIAEWARAYPEAAIVGCSGLAKKRNDVTWTGTLGDSPEPQWAGELDQVFFGAYSLENEVVFFHRASRTILSSDLIFNLSTVRSGLTRFVAKVIGNRQPGPTVIERVAIRDRSAARAQIDRMIAWDAERIVLAHGDIVAANGAAVLTNAYRWL